MGYLKRGLLEMMNLSNDLNLLAANNVIGYDTYSNSFKGLGCRPGSYNPYGIGALNSGLPKDVYTPNTSMNKHGTAALGFAFLGGLITDALLLNDKNGRKGSLLTRIKKSIGFKTTKAAGKKAVKAKGIKGILTKAGKACKIGAILAGVGVAATGVLRLYNAYKHQPLSATGQPQDTVSFSNNQEFSEN